MNVANWSEGEYPETDRTVAVAEFAGRKLWQFVDLIDERQGVDPEAIAKTLEGFAWDDDNVALLIHWKGRSDVFTTFEASFESGKLFVDSQVPHDFGRMSHGLRGAWADCWHDGSAERYDDGLRGMKWTPEDN